MAGTFALLIAAVLVLGALVLVTRALCRKWQSRPVGEAFPIEKLQALHESGQITEEEFARLRAVVMGLEAAIGEKDKCKSSGYVERDDEPEDAQEG